MPKDKTKATEQKKPEAKSKSRAAAKAKAPAKPAKKTAAKPRRTTPNRPGKVAAKAQSKAKAKTASRPHTVAMAVPVDSVLVGAAVRSFQASVPAAMFVLATQLPFLQSALRTTPLSGWQWLGAIGLALLLPLVIEVGKAIRRRRLPPPARVDVQHAVNPERALHPAEL